MKANDHYRFRYVNEAVGLMFLVTLLVFIAAVLGSGRFREWINPGSRLKVVMPAEGLFGLAEGADVEILGTQGGKVMEIVIDPDQQIYAEVQIKEGMESFIRRDSRAIIRKRYGLAGASYLEITRGKEEPLDWHYAVIKAEADRAPTETLTALIDDLQQRIIPLLDDAHTAIRSFSSVAGELQNPQGDLRLVLRNLKDITGNIARGKGTVGRLVIQKEMADTLETFLGQLRQAMNRLDPIMTSLDQTARNAASLTARIDTQAESLPTLLLQTEQVMVEMDKLLRQLQSNWLLGGSGAGEEAGPASLSPLEARP
jgi:phospholipid/cholesterol/gamma-HCH transport system substrate-binding protein